MVDRIHEPRFLGRLRRRVLDPTLAAVPVVALVFLPLRSHHLIANDPLWLLAALLGGGYVLSAAGTALSPSGATGWRLNVRVSVEMFVIALVIYAIGWGPTLALGLVFGVIDCTRTHGSGATRPAEIAGVMALVLGQAGISLHLVPTLVRPPLVDALSILAVLGLLVTAELLRWVWHAKEQAQAAVAANERRFKALVENASDIIVVCDTDGLIRYVSPAFERLLGYSSSHFTERPASELMHIDDLHRLRSDAPSIGDTVKAGWRTELRLHDVHDNWHWFEATITDRLDDPDVNGIVANLYDITDRKHAEEERREAHERFESSFEFAPIGVCICDLGGTIIKANRAYGQILGVEPGALPGYNVHDLTHPDDRDKSTVQMERFLTGSDETYHLEKRYLHAQGHEIWASVSVSAVRDADGQPVYLIGQIEDITERRALSEHLSHAALHDLLTDLPNRGLFQDRLETALARTARHAGFVAVAFLDLDRFKFVNDTCGHNTGDQLLRMVAARLTASVRPADTVARLGGDEFTILCEEIADEDDARQVLGRVMAALGQPFQVEGSEIFVSASIGAVLGRQPELPEQLLRRADSAMYRAKDRGRARIELFDERDDSFTVSRLHTLNDLHVALEHEQLELHYQPLVELGGTRLVGVEALVRWQHPQRGMLMPGEFISLAEDTGLIIPLGRWVLREACCQTARWRAVRGRSRDLSVAVNVSPRQLSDQRFMTDVSDALEESGLEPDALWLEITESTLLHDPDQTGAILRSARDLGVHIAIDDFGTGYSSLNYLQQLPVECLKVDRSFVSGLERTAASAAIVKAVIALSESLGLATIAEGVETTEQRDTLRANGCDLAQGYLFGHPRPATELADLGAIGLAAWPRPDNRLTSSSGPMSAA